MGRRDTESVRAGPAEACGHVARWARIEGGDVVEAGRGKDGCWEGREGGMTGEGLLRV